MWTIGQNALLQKSRGEIEEVGGRKGTESVDI